MNLGLHFPNRHLETNELDRITALQCGHYLIFIDNLADWPYWLSVCHQVRNRQPGARMHLRLEKRGGLGSPDGEAREAVAVANHFVGLASSWTWRNEPNIELPADVSDTKWGAWLTRFLSVARVSTVPVYAPPVSPGARDSRRFMVETIAAAKSAGVEGIHAHAYGNPDEAGADMARHRALWAGPIVVSEFNYGAGRSYDLGRYASELPEVSRRATALGIDALCLFIWEWRAPDVNLPTTVNVKHTIVEAEVARLNRQTAPAPQPTPLPGGTMTVIDPARLEFWHTWQVDRNRINEDPRDVTAFKKHLAGVGADPAGVADWGVPTVVPPSTPVWVPIDVRGGLPVRAGVPPYGPRVVILRSDDTIDTAASMGESLAAVNGITIHYTASMPAPGIPAVRHIATWQVGPDAQEKFPAIAYHLIVDSAGAVYRCHDVFLRVWHSGARVNNISRNVSHVGICYIGHSGPSAAQLDGMARAAVWAEKQIGRVLTVEGHRDPGYATKCPGGDSWPGWKASLLARIVAAR